MSTRLTILSTWLAAAAVLVLVTAGVLARQAEGPAPAPGKEWALVGGDETNARYSPLTQINTGTVKSLGGAWMRRFDEAGSSRQTPIVQGGRMFIAAGPIVYGLNAKTGEPIWKWRSDTSTGEGVRDNEGVQNMRQSLFQGLVLAAAEGMSAGEGMVFTGLSDGRVVALRQSDGTIAWAEHLGTDPLHQRGQSVSAATMYVRGVVFAGLANGDWGVTGRVVALDAKTGKQLWHFMTIPSPGEKGHDTWPKDTEIWKQGGAGVWHNGSIDADLGLVYFGTGNAAPVFGGEVRKGDNLYTNSVVALDIKTGALRWHYQFLHHDLWDTDLATPLVLYDTQVNGTTHKGLGFMRPDGYMFLLDRATGKPLLPIEERRVTQDAFSNTSPTQPFPVGDKLVPECETWRDKLRKGFVLDCPGFAPPIKGKENVVTPGVGVMRVTPIAFSRQTGYFYAQGTSSMIRPRRLSDDPWFWGQPAASPVPPLPSVNVLAAIDSRTNRIAWKVDAPPGAGPLTTAGGLMFRVAPDGNFEAYDAKSGTKLWEFQTGRPNARGPASTFDIDGEQYIAVAAGPMLWAFKLGGQVPPQPGFKATGALPPPPEANMIETATLIAGSENNGRRYAMDEHAFNPPRAGVKQFVRFLNNGRVVHTIVAEDGSWKVGPLKPSQQGGVAFEKPGTFTYYCQEHPWAIGQVVVQP